MSAESVPVEQPVVDVVDDSSHGTIHPAAVLASGFFEVILQEVSIYREKVASEEAERLELARITQDKDTRRAQNAVIAGFVATYVLGELVRWIEDKDTSDNVAAIGGSIIGWSFFIAVSPYLNSTKLAQRYNERQAPKQAKQSRIVEIKQDIQDLRREERNADDTCLDDEIATLKQELNCLLPKWKVSLNEKKNGLKNRLKPSSN
jgi:hypothetical protein